MAQTWRKRGMNVNWRRSLAFPGKVALRPMQAVLAEALDTQRSVGWLSELLNDAGRQAGEVLGGIDTSPLGAVIVARDETFFQGTPILLVIDPMSTTILLTPAHRRTACPPQTKLFWTSIDMGY